MTDRPPDELDELARQRAEARRAGDFKTADDLRAQIEVAGWKVVDSGYRFRLEPVPSASVPSLLDEPATAAASVVVTGGSEVPPTVLPAGVQVVAVGAAPENESMGGAEVVGIDRPLGLAEAWNVGLRRSVGEVVVLLGPGAKLTTDVVTPILDALADETVAVVGAQGLISTDLRQWREADEGGRVDALDASCLAFRRADAATRGPLDERFSSARLLAIWWSLVLRDEGVGAAPRRAVALELPLEVSEAREEASDDRRARRDLYRVIDRFGRRYDLLREPVIPTKAARRARRTPPPRRPGSPPAGGG